MTAPLKLNFALLLFICFTFTAHGQINKLYYYTNSGEVAFKSEAEQELIKATSNKLIGILDAGNGTFVFKVMIRSFSGFNSLMQQEHFNEKYLESEEFPEASFSGKIIENIDLSIAGVYEVRTKGILKMHGVEIERVIKCFVSVKNDKIFINSKFSILLSDHSIKIPKVVHEKVAGDIGVEVSLVLNKKSN